LPGAEAEHIAATRALAETEAALARLAGARAGAEADLAACRQASAACGADLARLDAEIEGLRAVIGLQGGRHTPALDSLLVPQGLEAALGAALAHAPQASLDPAAPESWRALPALPLHEAPRGTTPLSALVAAPAALLRTLSAAFLLGEGEEGEAVQPRLAPGQVAVDRAGSAWLWDGLVRRPGATEAAAARLQHRRRLDAALASRDAAEAAADQAAQAEQMAEAAAAVAAGFEADARRAREGAEARLRTARDDHTALAALAARQSVRLADLLPAIEQAQVGHDEAASRLLAAQAALAASAGDESAAAAAEAAGLAEAAARALAEARLARQAARARVAASTAAWQRLSQTAAEAETRHAALTPLRARARSDAEAAARALADAEARAATAEAALGAERAQASCEAEAAAAARAEQAAAAARDAAERALDEARERTARLEAARVQGESRLAARETLLGRSAHENDEAAKALQAARLRRQQAASAQRAAEAEAAARAILAAARAASLQTAARLRDLQAESARIGASQAQASASLAALRARAAEAERRSDALAQRLDVASRDSLRLREAASDFEDRAEKSGAALAEAEAAHTLKQTGLSAAEACLREAAAAEREQQTRLAFSREHLARAEGARDAAQSGLLAVRARIADRLGPDAAQPEAPDISQAAEDQARKKLDRLIRERDEMGPVNLRAETELAELDQRIAAIEQDRAELEAAIAKLRTAIGHLNREGRARLTAVFEAVDTHFRALFTRMMGGGRAHLAWSGSDDPLLAGLEIYAEPPGKKLAALSLLSGGEQALTALSLIFAVFRCTPAPICVLDEVDAPLDDANVDRFCSLLDEIVRQTGTRFLVVTHHQLTMSRMDRLFGVTMQERGVSRLLSVDLTAAAAIGAQVLRAAE
jgi:chromosome segregation protein